MSTIRYRMSCETVPPNGAKYVLPRGVTLQMSDGLEKRLCVAGAQPGGRLSGQPGAIPTAEDSEDEDAQTHCDPQQLPAVLGLHMATVLVEEP